MKELKRTDRLTIISILVVAVLAIGYFTLRTPDVRFTRTVRESIPLITAGQDLISPEKVAKLAGTGDAAYYIIDLRSPIEFHKSHIPDAVNIPAQNILDPDNQSLLKKLAEQSKTVILYSQDQVQSNSVWIILKQIGFDHINVMPGGFQYYSSMNTDLNNLNEVRGFTMEKPTYDFPAILDSLSGDQPSAVASPGKTEPVQLIKREKKSQAEGGC